MDGTGRPEQYGATRGDIQQRKVAWSGRGGAHANEHNGVAQGGSEGCRYNGIILNGIERPEWHSWIRSDVEKCTVARDSWSDTKQHSAPGGDMEQRGARLGERSGTEGHGVSRGIAKR